MKSVPPIDLTPWFHGDAVDHARSPPPDASKRAVGLPTGIGRRVRVVVCR